MARTSELSKMRILLFFIWLTLGLAYFLIWDQRDLCCDLGSQKTSILSSLLSQVAPASETDPNAPFKDSLTNKLTNPVLTNKVSDRAETDIQDVKPGCLLFKWGQSDPVTRPCFNAWRDSIVKSLQEGQMIELIGEYFDRENQVMASGDIGLLRAVKTKKLFHGAIGDARVKIRSRSVPERDSLENKSFPALQVHTIFYNELIKELDEKTLIYFAYGVEDQIHNQWLETYADHLVQTLKNTKDELLLVGHTDDDATAVSNQKLGLQRAELIKYLLVSKGFKASRIRTSSKGESSPIAPNDTEQNRSLNRRVELFIVPPNQSK